MFANDATLERFWAKVNKHGPLSVRRPDLGPCWLWTGAKINGYGVFSLAGTAVRAHRFAYETRVEPIEAGLVPDHLCDTRACVRPSHIQIVTQRANVLRGSAPTAKNATKTTCARGHAFDDLNTHERASGGRRCRICNAEDARKLYRKTHPEQTPEQRSEHARLAVQARWKEKGK